MTTATQLDNLAIAALQDMLINVAELASQAKQAHWNVRGAAFLTVHQWLDDLAQNLRAHADTLAERIAALGGWPDACSETLSERNSLESLPFGALTTGQALAAMDNGLGRVAAGAAAWLRNPAVDQVTADHLTGLCRDVQNQQWLARAQQ
ncbi:starvation-inducible DNA-binding protein [Nonomuraea thailandensis]|uniref:Starvation-inducible DNA-binding protein n=1 Tax=Nonomuraea thailandensis TaxID=1188745 RepID=A0A9X2K5X2_9ACTN|nr:ferritin-like domain-containing protein [Nonomuraea thailandensis]MCP2358031.1 starvation-inducible DNA-binding protein [Nonomuraea thailandensis]